MRIRAEARTDTGRVRASNEDAVGFDVDRGVFLVCDGMGGHAGGEVASQMAVETVLARTPSPVTAKRAAASSDATMGIRDSFVASLQAANEMVWRKSLADPSLHGMGTTLVAARVDGDTVWIAHAGDSRAYRLRNGALTALTEDHSEVNEQLRDGRITPEEARAYGRQNVITRALGIAPRLEMDVAAHRLIAGDLHLFCTDGLTGLVPDAEIQRLLAAANPDQLGAACERLVAEANARGGRDNVTVLLLHADSAGFPLSGSRGVAAAGILALAGAGGLAYGLYRSLHG